MTNDASPEAASAGPEGSRVFAVSTGALPADLLEQASRRLGMASLIYAAAYALGYMAPAFVGALLTPYRLSELIDALQMVVALVAIALSLTFFFITRFARVKPELLLDLGLIFEVVAALGIAMNVNWSREWPNFGGVPWEGVWILIFPMLAPNTPGKTLLAALGAATMGPLSILVSAAAGATPTSSLLPFAIYFTFTNYVCAGIAYAISRTLYRFGRRLKEAQEIGSYRLVARLGQGGMGEVWIANHRLLARPAAIKLIRRELLAPAHVDRKTVVRRFEQEARATAALRSKHTIELYDFGISEDGSFYYVMELLDGWNFDALVKRFGPVRAERTVHFLRQVCHSLGEAHRNGLIHRDIKPANIFACRLGPDVDFVKVLDFGIVKTTRERHAEGTQLTAENVTPGTPSFMAPELAAGDAIDGRADIYALGCVGYWLLTGQLVFDGATPLAIAMQHLQSAPVPPSRRTEIEIPDSLERIILACLAKDRADRPQSADELDARLAACMPDRAWTRERAEEWWRLHKPEAAPAVGDAEAADRPRKLLPIKG